MIYYFVISNSKAFACLACGIVVACGQGALEISELQRAGKSPMFARDFLRGFPLEPGEILA